MKSRNRFETKSLFGIPESNVIKVPWIRRCSSCEVCLFEVFNFHRKGDRYDAKCRQCVNVTDRKLRKEAREIRLEGKRFEVEMIGEPDLRQLGSKLSILTLEVLKEVQNEVIEESRGDIQSRLG